MTFPGVKLRPWLTRRGKLPYSVFDSDGLRGGYLCFFQKTQIAYSTKQGYFPKNSRIGYWKLPYHWDSKKRAKNQRKCKNMQHPTRYREAGVEFNAMKATVCIQLPGQKQRCRSFKVCDVKRVWFPEAISHLKNKKGRCVVKSKNAKYLCKNGKVYRMVRGKKRWCDGIWTEGMSSKGAEATTASDKAWATKLGHKIMAPTCGFL